MSKARRAAGLLKRRFTELSDLPRELVGSSSRMVLMGNSEFMIENYDGVLEYEESRIKLSTKTGIISVAGNKLTIDELDDENLMVRGKIYSITIESEE
ncbi:MAG: YabP/YqfC family sporulation protein [Clostridia bacterium]|nr:YabP/YqfC family sporulation protein [Clostridia bacterium]